MAAQPSFVCWPIEAQPSVHQDEMAAQPSFACCEMDAMPSDHHVLMDSQLAATATARPARTAMMATTAAPISTGVAPTRPTSVVMTPTTPTMALTRGTATAITPAIAAAASSSVAASRGFSRTQSEIAVTTATMNGATNWMAAPSCSVSTGISAASPLVMAPITGDMASRDSARSGPKCSANTPARARMDPSFSAMMSMAGTKPSAPLSTPSKNAVSPAVKAGFCSAFARPTRITLAICEARSRTRAMVGASAMNASPNARAAGARFCIALCAPANTVVRAVCQAAPFRAASTAFRPAARSHRDAAPAACAAAVSARKMPTVEPMTDPRARMFEMAASTQPKNWPDSTTLKAHASKRAIMREKASPSTGRYREPAPTIVSRPAVMWSMPTFIRPSMSVRFEKNAVRFCMPRGISKASAMAPANAPICSAARGSQVFASGRNAAVNRRTPPSAVAQNPLEMREPRSSYWVCRSPMYCLASCMAVLTSDMPVTRPARRAGASSTREPIEATPCMMLRVFDRPASIPAVTVASEVATFAVRGMDLSRLRIVSMKSSAKRRSMSAPVRAPAMPSTPADTPADILDTAGACCAARSLASRSRNPDSSSSASTTICGLSRSISSDISCSCARHAAARSGLTGISALRPRCAAASLACSSARSRSPSMVAGMFASAAAAAFSIWCCMRATNRASRSMRATRTSGFSFSISSTMPCSRRRHDAARDRSVGISASRSFWAASMRSCSASRRCSPSTVAGIVASTSATALSSWRCSRLMNRLSRPASCTLTRAPSSTASSTFSRAFFACAVRPSESTCTWTLASSPSSCFLTRASDLPATETSTSSLAVRSALSRIFSRSLRNRPAAGMTRMPTWPTRRGASMGSPSCAGPRGRHRRCCASRWSWTSSAAAAGVPPA